ncbi:hypothetical protein ZWY2020_000232 [Hordeum vulgare]|nr:hypothetical protein ZWY2020_000232 [Hordeum vulgare]
MGMAGGRRGRLAARPPPPHPFPASSPSRAAAAAAAARHHPPPTHPPSSVPGAGGYDGEQPPCRSCAGSSHDPIRLRPTLLDKGKSSVGALRSDTAFLLDNR